MKYAYVARIGPDDRLTSAEVDAESEAEARASIAQILGKHGRFRITTLVADPRQRDAADPSAAEITGRLYG